MVEVKELIRQANDLHERAKREEDPNIRDRLNRMADTYSHMAEIESGAAPPSVHGLMDALTNPDNGPSAERSPPNAMPEPPSGFHETNKRALEAAGREGTGSRQDLDRRA